MKAPRRYGVYRLRDSDGRLLYVGASVSPRLRQSRHRSTRPWGKDVDPGRLTVDWYETEAEAAAAELEAIATEAPLHNRHGADWKMIPYRYDRFQPKIRPETKSVEMAIQAIGDSTLEVIADNWRRAKSMERDAMARLTGAIIASAVQGQPETVIAERAGVNRMTVRKALGK